MGRLGYGACFFHFNGIKKVLRIHISAPFGVISLHFTANTGRNQAHNRQIPSFHSPAPGQKNVWIPFGIQTV
jgi:hypothetical protein